MERILDAAVYCGTYRKYNNGSIAGKWLKLSKYESKNDFLQTCSQLHKDESDPEFMFQDYENVPESMIDESFISDEIWKVLAILKKYDAKRQEAFAEWCEANGYEQDLQAIKEFSTIKFKKNSLPHEFLLKEEFAKIWENDKGMQNYYLKNTSNCVLTSFGGLVTFDKPKIETRFCFGYSDCGQGQTYNDAQKESENFGEEQFLKENLADMKHALDLFEGKKETNYRGKKELYFTKKYMESEIYRICFLVEYDAEKDSGLRKATDEDFQKCYAVQKEEYEKFEKRLKSYLKRYGTKKLTTWTYWMDE